MGAVDTPQSGGGKGKRRVGIRIDMTPMVDVAFLLLIFFMVTTVFRQPQALEISLPPKDAPPVPVAQSNVMTLRVLPGPAVYYSIGDVKLNPYKKAKDDKDLAQIVGQASKENPKLIVVIKIARDAKYESMVDVIDELQVHGVSRFGLAKLTDAERAEVEGIQ